MTFHVLLTDSKKPCNYLQTNNCYFTNIGKIERNLIMRNFPLSKDKTKVEENGIVCCLHFCSIIKTAHSLNFINMDHYRRTY